MNSPSRYPTALLWILLLICSVHGGEVALDLPKAIQRSLEQNLQLQRAARLLRKSQLGVRSSEADFAVTVTPDGSAGTSANGDDWQYGLKASKRFIMGTKVEVGGRLDQSNYAGDDLHSVTLDVEVQQPLFRNFGSLVQGEALRQAASAFNSSRRQYQEQRADTIVRVVDLYESIIRLERQIQSDEEFYDRMEKLYRLTKARERQGHTTRVDTLRVELQRGQAQLRLETSRERLSFAQRDLAETLGYPIDTQFRLEPAPRLQVHIASSEKAIETALRNRLDYADTLQDYRDAERTARITRRLLYPDVSLLTRYQRSGEGDGFSEAGRLDENDWFAGLALSSDLNRRQDRITIQQSEIEAQAALENVQVRELSITREVQQSITTYHRAVSEAAIAERNAKLAEGRAKLARRLFSLGRGDNFSVTDAEEAYARAQSDSLTSQADVSVSAYRVLRALGTLIDYPAELKPVPLEKTP